jgi:hypothetical protein
VIESHYDLSRVSGLFVRQLETDSVTAEILIQDLEFRCDALFDRHKHQPVGVIYDWLFELAETSAKTCEMLR